MEDKYEQNLIDKYEDALAKLGFEKKIETPTREEIVRRNGMNQVQRSCIDHVYAKNMEEVVKGGVLTEKISDHYYTMCWIWNPNKNNEENEDKKGKGEYTKITYNNKNIIQEMKQLNWSDLEQIISPNEIYDVMIRRINNIYIKNEKKKEYKK